MLKKTNGYPNAAYGNTLVCFMGFEADKTDQQLDLAEKLLEPE